MSSKVQMDDIMDYDVFSQLPTRRGDACKGEVSGNCDLKVWGVESGGLSASFSGGVYLPACAISPDGVTIRRGAFPAADGHMGEMIASSKAES